MYIYAPRAEMSDRKPCHRSCTSGNDAVSSMFQVSCAGERGWAVSAREDSHDAGVTNSMDMLLVLLMVF